MIISSILLLYFVCCLSSDIGSLFTQDTLFTARVTRYVTNPIDGKFELFVFSGRVERDYSKVRAYLQRYYLNWQPGFTSPYLSPPQRLPRGGESEVRVGAGGRWEEEKGGNILYSLSSASELPAYMVKAAWKRPRRRRESPYSCFRQPVLYLVRTQVRTLSSFFADELYLGCYETQNNESNLYKPRLSTINSYKCIEACAYEMFPLAAVLNDTDCHCANDSVTPLIETDPCGGSRKSTNRFEVYNTSCLLVEFVEIYQELTFTTFPPNITPSVSSSLMLVTPSSVTATNSSQTIVYSVDFGDGRSNGTRVLRHHYLAIGEFNITLVASRGNSTIFVLSRRIRILSRAKVANVSCSAIKPNHTVVCKLNGLRGSDITASIAMYNTGQNVSLLVPGMFSISTWCNTPSRIISLYS